MEIKGRVQSKPAADTGVSSRGHWKKAYLVVRYEEGQYPKDILLTCLKRAEDFEKIEVGSTGTFKFDADTRQANNGKWYCDLKCWDWNIESQPSAKPSEGDPF